MVILSTLAFEALHERIKVLEASNAELIHQIIELKRDGFSRPQPAAIVRVESDLDPRIMAAISAVSVEGSNLQRQLMEFATASLLADNEIEDVADMILTGSNFRDED